MISLQTAEIDPNVVKPGWVALLIVLALGAATVLLWRNMGKQLKRIDFDRDGADDPAPSDGPATPDPSPTPATDATPTTTAPTQTPSDSKEHSEH
ncbi:hypothetical protein [Kribbella sindirgiensis]|uniref:Uncharacterized protein n=1 Tax=Kribbella sindirgiensis TaxID=1124744 RepID=A0A4R0J610_9ACTN|nr:hypothetical protein [Kribbella sindirgiensis]TCC39628.1 hypothetical protein E0H50_06825 [Kribbella sindirgiensis]